MPIYKGSQKIKDIYYGNIKIGKIYKGSTLLYTSLAYPLDTVLFESSTPGTSTVELEKGIYEVYCIGGGGEGAVDQVTNKKGGGSGAGYIGVVSLEKGSYIVTIGNGQGGNSSISNVVTAYGGESSHHFVEGKGGAMPTITATEISYTLKTAGNGGNSLRGGASVYNGYGKGGDAGDWGNSGYVKIVYKGN